MKKFFSTFSFMIILAVLGFAAYAAFPQRSEAEVLNVSQASASDFSNGAGAAPEAPAATLNYNAIGMPLNASASIGDADALATAIAGTQTVLKWDAGSQTFDFWIPGVGIGNNFAVTTGDAFLVQVDSTAPTVFSIVGDVPSQSGAGSVSHSLVGNATCKYNFITVPLSQSSITTADQLATAIGDVDTVLVWDAASQTFDFWIPGIGIGNNFAVNSGYPYWVCMTASKTWPS